jgi:hypothetical protein
MKPLFQTIVAAVAGLAAAGVILAVLVPALVEAGLLDVGSNAAAWTVGGVIAACVAVAVLRPWRHLTASSDRKHR